jgi:diguanylate cyclase (GGDEF)-like protein
MLEQVQRITSCDHFKFLLQLESHRAIRYTYFFLFLIVEIDPAEHSGHMPVLSDLISRSIRGSDFIGLEDDRQCLLLFPNAEISDAVRISERLKGQVERQRFTFNGRLDRITVSIGGACFPTHAIDPQELLLTANDMLRKAKLMGGNRICLP